MRKLYPRISFILVLLIMAISMNAQSGFSDEKIVSDAVSSLQVTFAADLDGDNDLDVISGSGNDILAWYENTDGKGTFGALQQIANTCDNIKDVQAADIDGDGDMDILTASYLDDKIAWFENTDGQGTFSAEKVITTAADYAWSVAAADFDGDGDMDVASGSSVDDRIAWYENTDGKGTFGAMNTISLEANGCRKIFAADMDKDGDIDLMSADQFANSIAWYENTDGEGTFSARKVISNKHAETFYAMAADIDGDGDNDAVASSPSDDEVAWFENTDGAGTFGEQRLISTAEDGSRGVWADDLDGDGDVDVMATSQTDSTVAWFENTDGAGTFGERKIVKQNSGKPANILTADLNGDGKQDLLVAYHYGDLVWFENQYVEEPEISHTTIDVSCYGEADGSIGLDVTGGSEPFTYLWSNDSTDQDISGLTEGEYSVIITDAYGNEFYDTAHVYQPDAINISVNQSDEVLISMAEDAQFQWIDCSDNSSIDGAVYENFTATVNGDYAVIVTIGSCSDTSACYSVTNLVSAEAHNFNSFNIYPNPAGSLFTIEGGIIGRNTHISIMDMSGREVISEIVRSEGVFTFDSELTPGIYLVKVSKDNLRTQKILVID